MDGVGITDLLDILITNNQKTMNTKHTPAPWSIYNVGSTLAIDIGEEPTGVTPNVVNWPGFDGNGLSRKQNVANARLISAAPDLLEALEEYLNAGCKESRRAASVHAKTAISKALGTSLPNKEFTNP